MPIPVRILRWQSEHAVPIPDGLPPKSMRLRDTERSLSADSRESKCEPAFCSREAPGKGRRGRTRLRNEMVGGAGGVGITFLDPDVKDETVRSEGIGGAAIGTCRWSISPPYV